MNLVEGSPIKSLSLSNTGIKEITNASGMIYEFLDNGDRELYIDFNISKFPEGSSLSEILIMLAQEIQFSFEEGCK